MSSNKEKIQSLILDNTYINWLDNFMKEYNSIDNTYFLYNNKLRDIDISFINKLKDLFIELNKYVVKNNVEYDNIFGYILKYSDKNYYIYYNGEGFGCNLVSDTYQNIPFIDYNSFRKIYRRNMNENFKKLDRRVYETLISTDLEKINYELSKINDPTLVSGIGGSSVVSEFTAKVLTKKNHIITHNTEPRDFKYLDLSLYKNVLSCSYSGNNYGVELSFLNDLKHYLLASKKSKKEDVINLTYKNDDIEKSFISLAATVIPCAVMLNYYLPVYNQHLIIDYLDSYKFDFDVNCDAYEIFTGIDSSVASKYLESTMIESGIGIPIIHDKYSYCHGRSTTSINNNNVAIYLDTHKELDKLLLRELPKYYKDIVVINVSSNSPLGEYDALIQSMYLTKYIAEQKNVDLSGVDYSPIVKKLYKYNKDL